MGKYCVVGHIIYSRIDDDDDILDQRCEFIKQVYNLYGYFIKLNSVTKSCSFRAYCSIACRGVNYGV